MRLNKNDIAYKVAIIEGTTGFDKLEIGMLRRGWDDQFTGFMTISAQKSSGSTEHWYGFRLTVNAVDFGQMELASKFSKKLEKEFEMMSKIDCLSLLRWLERATAGQQVFDARIGQFYPVNELKPKEYKLFTATDETETSNIRHVLALNEDEAREALIKLMPYRSEWLESGSQKVRELQHPYAEAPKRLYHDEIVLW